MSEEKKQYKWTVKQGGTLPVDAISVKHSTEQKGSTSQAQSLAINKGGDNAPTIDMNSFSVNHATTVPDGRFGQREFAMGEGKPIIDNESFSVKNATSAPKPPRTINTVDKANMVSNNATGY